MPRSGLAAGPEAIAWIAAADESRRMAPRFGCLLAEPGRVPMVLTPRPACLRAAAHDFEAEPRLAARPRIRHGILAPLHDAPFKFGPIPLDADDPGLRKRVDRVPRGSLP
ncbi:MAG: hypothetical protein VB138_00585 [Burkholderia sp.]